MTDPTPTPTAEERAWRLVEKDCIRKAHTIRFGGFNVASFCSTCCPPVIAEIRAAERAALERAAQVADSGQFCGSVMCDGSDIAAAIRALKSDAKEA